MAYPIAFPSTGLPPGVATGFALVSNGIGLAPVYSATPGLTSLALGGATIGTNAAAITGTLQLNSAGNAIATGGDLSLYNTADQTTNYERLRMYASGNVFNIASEKGGTGNLRDITYLGGLVTFPSSGANFLGGLKIGSATGIGWNTANTIGTNSTGLIGFSNGATGNLGLDTTWSRTGVATMALGNGTQGDISGKLQAASLALGGATIGTYALSVTGTGVTSGSFNSIGSLYAGGDQGATNSSYIRIDNTGIQSLRNGSGSYNGIQLGVGGLSTWGFLNQSPRAFSQASTNIFGWSPTVDSSLTPDTILTRRAAASLNLGAADAASPVAQTLSTQGSRSGTDSNVAGANLTIASGNGTGNATGSTLNLQTPVAVASGTGAQTMTTQVAINSTGVTITPPLSLGNNLTMGGNAIVGMGNTNGASGSGPAFQGATAASATVPTLVPRQGDTKAGIGADALGDVSIIADNAGTATEMIRVTGTLVSMQASPLVLKNYIVSGLPAAGAAGAGATAFVTDANTTFSLGLGAAVAGGGANKVPVYSDGTSWIVG